MIDISIVREKYAAMLDSQLIAIAKHDGHELTHEAFIILKEEFQKRQLDESYIEQVQHTKQLAHESAIERFKATDDISKAALQYAIDEKLNGTPNQNIIAALLERGLDISHAAAIITSLPIEVKKIIERQKNNKLFGAGLFMVGIFISLYSFSAANAKGGYYVITTGAVILGAARFFKSSAQKNKYERLLKSIAAG